MIKNKKVFIAALLIFCMFCCCAFSYAAYSSQLTVNGTVDAQGKFDVQFNTKADTLLYNKDDIKVKVKSVGDDTVNGDATHANDKVVLDITLPAKYNSSFSFDVPVKNLGTTKAVASAIASSTKSNVTLSATKVDLEPAGTSGDTGNIKVTLTASSALAPGSTITGFELTIVYNQNDIDPAPTPTHVD